ncbi:hypothetical protein FRC11_002746, partial [Ceratobasidium sp. 423]
MAPLITIISDIIFFLGISTAIGSEGSIAFSDPMVSYLDHPLSPVASGGPAPVIQE